MSYTKMQIIELVIGLVGCVVFCILLYYHDAIGPSVIVALAMIVAMCLMEYFRAKKYPQWRGLRWKMPWILIIIAFVALFLFAGVDILFITFDNDILEPIWLVILVILMPSYTIYYAKKYELDKLSSVEELVEAHPEVKEKLQTPVI